MCLFFKHIDHDVVGGQKWRLSSKVQNYFSHHIPLALSQKIRAPRHIKIKLLLKMLLPYVVIIPPIGGIYNTRGVGIVDEEHGVLGWVQFIIRVGQDQ